MTDNYYVNIVRPYPGTGENEQQISFIEPLRKDNRIQVSHAYWYNLRQYEAGLEPSCSPGFRYEFIFQYEEDALAFKLIFGEREIK